MAMFLHLLQAALFLMAFMTAGFECLHSALHVPLKHLSVLTVLAFCQPPGHEMTTVLPLILYITAQHKNTATLSITADYSDLPLLKSISLE